MPGLEGLISNASISGQLKENLASVMMQPLDPRTDLPVSSKIFAFQYYPETYDDSKEVNWPTKEIPGASLPLYQWVSAGARTISFTAKFSCDLDLMYSDKEVKAADIWDSIVKSGLGGRNADLRTVMVFLRHLQLPRYDVSGGRRVTLPPPKIFLTIPRSGIGAIGGAYGGKVLVQDSIVCILTQANFNVLAAFPSGLPKLIDASLAFAQVAQVAGYVQFPESLHLKVEGQESVDVLAGFQAGNEKYYAYDVAVRTR